VGKKRSHLLGDQSADNQLTSAEPIRPLTAVVKEVKIVPFGKETIIRFLVVIALPLSPLAFTVFSAEELLKRLFSVLL
jgi:hypothetical protein